MLLLNNTLSYTHTHKRSAWGTHMYGVDSQLVKFSALMLLYVI